MGNIYGEQYVLLENALNLTEDFMKTIKEIFTKESHVYNHQRHSTSVSSTGPTYAKYDDGHACHPTHYLL
ncbi:hypothetical protein [Bacillus sp. ISL-75]|uniref:hypothetical protein n=1 Tax=Bacillus sp. ISL-75 TaxID=2819137 RepID=UPI0025544888